MKKIVVIFFAAVMVIGCKVPQSSSVETVPYTVGLQKKVKNLESNIQFWVSENTQFTLSVNDNGYSVDENGIIVVSNEKIKTTFLIKKNTPGILDHEEKGIYWVRFDPDDERLVPFQKTGTADGDIFKLAVQVSNTALVLLSDKKKYLHTGNPYLKISKKFASTLDNNAKVAKGVKIAGDQ